MAHYVVGDVQGCFSELQALLQQVDFQPSRDRLSFLGDLIARGPDSLAVMRWVLAHSDCCDAVLGNHDLHFLAIAAGYKSAKPSDHIDALLADACCTEVVQWFREQALVRFWPDQGVCLVHAGIWPGLSIADLAEAAQLVQDRLMGDAWEDALKTMYGNQPTRYHSDDSAVDRARFLINACTRMRFLTADGALEFTAKEHPNETTETLIPWMCYPGVARTARVLFGHWASLRGDALASDCVGLDTGCVWGGSLTMLRLEDDQRFHEPSHGHH